MLFTAACTAPAAEDEEEASAKLDLSRKKLRKSQYPNACQYSPEYGCTTSNWVSSGTAPGIFDSTRNPKKPVEGGPRLTRGREAIQRMATVRKEHGEGEE